MKKRTFWKQVLPTLFWRIGIVAVLIWQQYQITVLKTWDKILLEQISQNIDELGAVIEQIESLALISTFHSNQVGDLWELAARIGMYIDAICAAVQVCP